jgi:hypothetical protein
MASIGVPIRVIGCASWRGSTRAAMLDEDVNGSTKRSVDLIYAQSQDVCSAPRTGPEAPRTQAPRSTAHTGPGVLLQLGPLP